MRRLALLLIAVLLVACDGESDVSPTPSASSTEDVAVTSTATPRITYLNTPTPTPAWTRTPEPTPAAQPVGHPPGTRTGIAIVDAVVDAFVRGDEGALNDLIDWQTAPCVQEPVNDYGPPPVCSEAQTVGDLTQYIPVSACHGGYRIPAEEEFTFQFARNGGRLYGVRLPLEFDDPRARYVVVVSTAAGPSEYGHALGVSERGIVNQELGCLFSPEYLWRQLEPIQVLLPPPSDALYGYPPELRHDDGGVVDQVAVGVTARLPAQLRELLAPNEAACFAHIRISAQSADDCAETPDDPDDPAFAVSGCHAGVRTVEEFERALYDALDHRPRLYGARRVAGWWDERATVVLVFARPSLEPAPAFAILLSDDGIVGFDGSCGEEAAGLWAKYDDIAVGTPMLPPWDAR